MSLAALLPLIILAVGAMVTLLLAAFVRHHGLVVAAGLAGTGLFVASLFWSGGQLPAEAGPLLLVDRFALFYWALLGLATVVVMLLCFSHFQKSGTGDGGSHPAASADDMPEELYGLLMLATLGACVLTATTHFMGLFLGLELLSVPLFVLIAYRCQFARPVEAGIKYLVLSGLATGFLLFGIALVYSYTGSLAFAGSLAVEGSQVEGSQGLSGHALNHGYWVAGMALILAGLSFKLSLVPFHFWTPDVYQGAAAPVTAYLATVSKTAALAVLLRLAVGMDLAIGDALWSTLAGIAALSILAGNWLALRQGNLKRLLAYSSIAHMGYALAALLATGALAVEAVSFYLVFYVVTTLGAFAVVVALSRDQRHGEWEAVEHDAIRGLFWQRPWLALTLTLMMFSLAGIPLTAGFFGKFYVLLAGAEAGLWRLMLLVVLGSAIGLYYYLRVVLAMLERHPTESRSAPTNSAPTAFCLVLLTLALVGLGIYPEPLMNWAASLTAS